MAQEESGIARAERLKSFLVALIHRFLRLPTVKQSLAFILKTVKLYFMDLQNYAPLFTYVGTSMMAGGGVSAGTQQPSWVTGALFVIGFVLAAVGHYYGHQTVKDIKATQDDHTDALDAIAAPEAAAVKVASIIANSPPVGSLPVIQPNPVVPTIQKP